MSIDSAKDEIKRPNTELERSQVRVYTGLERRSGQDRREHQLSMFKRLFFNGIRESARRIEDRNCIVVFDRYKPSLFIAIMIVLGLSLLDALLTLILLSQGATELNPVMRYFLPWTTGVHLRQVWAHRIIGAYNSVC